MPGLILTQASHIGEISCSHGAEYEDGSLMG
jgi:hypothetical protein